MIWPALIAAVAYVVFIGILIWLVITAPFAPVPKPGDEGNDDSG